MAIPNDLRQINRRQVLSTLLRGGPATRSGLARATGLSQPTAGKIVEELISEGAVQTVTADPAAANRLGRPGHVLALDDSRPRFLAVQLGVNHTRLAPLTVAPPPGDDWAKVFDTPKSIGAWKSAVAAAAKKCTKPGTTAALVSVPGVLDEVTGRALLSPNIRWLEGHDVAAAVSDALGVPAYAIQEIRCLALGHRALAPTLDDFLLVDFGTGIGSAAMIRGALLQGQLPLSGELGHTPVPGNTLPCGCGGVGCLETMVGRNAILERVGIANRDWAGPWQETIARLAHKPPPARLRQALEAAGLGIAGALNVLGLDRVIVTGFLSSLPEPVFDILRQSIQSASVAGRFGVVQTVAAPRHRLAGLSSVGIDRVLAPA